MSRIDFPALDCILISLDLTQSNGPEKLLNYTEKHLGMPSVLVNNATYSQPTPPEDFSEDELDRHYQLNMRATTLLTLGFAKRFERSRQLAGAIINLTSGQSLGPMPDELAYAMTKSAIETLTRTLAARLMQKGITLNAVNPGPVDTGWMEPSFKAQLSRRFPGGSVGQPEDVAALIAFLAGPASRWVTGQVIHAEGGFNRYF